MMTTRIPSTTRSRSVSIPRVYRKCSLHAIRTGKIEVGAEIFINHDDDTMNGIPDKDDPVPLTTAQDTDLYELDLGIAPITSGEVSLSYDTNLRMWASRDKQLLPTPIDYVFNGPESWRIMIRRRFQAPCMLKVRVWEALTSVVSNVERPPSPS